MVLIIDNGNTFLKATIYTNNGKEVDFSETKSKQKLDSFFNKIKKHNKVKKCYICSVVPSSNKTLKDAIEKVFKIKPIFVQNNQFINAFDLSKFNINEVGTDILAFALYLQKTYKKSIGICYGTALFAIGVDNKKLLGAIILPHIDTGLKELSRKTEMINNEKIDFNHSSLEFGHNTKEALTSGINHFYMGVTTNIVNYFHKFHKFNNLCLTGGNRLRLKLFDKSNEKIKVFDVSNAVTKGLACLILKNNKNI